MDIQALLESAGERIQRYRTARTVVRVVDERGKPVVGARVRAEQTAHAFLFGCNVFPVLGYDDPAREAAYEQRFAGLLNFATLPFYWGGYEPDPGVTRAEKLAAQARWCLDHGIRPKGHPLVWHEVYPAWAPSEVDETRMREAQRVREIVSGFAGLIDWWDVVNEATVSAKFDNGVGHWAQRDGVFALVAEALGWARAANPRAVLLYNDYNLSPEYEALARQLADTGQPHDALGIQSHMHGGEWPLEKAWQVCDTYARFGRPLHFTELTVLSGEHGWEKPAPWPTTADGEARQADYVAQLYTLLFSHPAVQAITWWDFMDGGWQGAPAGLVRADLTPKPVYDRLLALVKDAWWTTTAMETDAGGEAAFQGFKGAYRLTISTPAGAEAREVAVTEDGRVEISLGAC